MILGLDTAFAITYCAAMDAPWSKEKSEIRISKFETSSNRQKKKKTRNNFVLDHFSIWRIRICFGFRDSNFEFS